MSSVKKLSGIQSYGWNYGQDGITFTVKLNHETTSAWQIYHNKSSLAILPLWDNFANVVWSVPSMQAKEIYSLSNESLIEKMNNILQSYDSESDLPLRSALPPRPLPRIRAAVLEEINNLKESIKFISETVSGSYQRPPLITTIASGRASFPLNYEHVRNYVLPGIALAGDSAHSIHPQAGQGLNLGIADAKALVEVIMSSLSTGTDIGSMRSLRPYEDERLLRNAAVLHGVDVIHRFFQAENPLVERLRDYGVMSVHGTPVIKKLLMGVATGIYEH